LVICALSAGCRESKRKSGREVSVNPAPSFEPFSPLDRESDTEACWCKLGLARLGWPEIFALHATCELQESRNGGRYGFQGCSSTGQLDVKARQESGAVIH
jgi:hypothetical protein